ncbi:hypothetical protein ACIBL8_05410 [Streptomyces sp. NPDC050523]|uniref:Rv1733c family protein n=1 Tax=Streptomyces sp. NPDC050523 TaxID=3365622 RepID=UPI00379E6080
MNGIRSRRQGRVRWWRLRRNPLRRRSYLVEAWLLFATGILALGAAIVSGVLTAHAVQRDLDGLRAERHQVPAVVTEDVRPAPGVDGMDGMDGNQVWAHVRYKAADGTTRKGVARVDSARSKSGSTTEVWLDARGNLVREPTTPGEAEFQGAVMGAVAAVSAGAAVILISWYTRGRLDRRRREQWDTEWAVIDPKWGRKTG